MEEILGRLVLCLKCPLCNELPSVPYTLIECGHTFCQTCLMKKLGIMAKCPQCDTFVLIKNSRRNPSHSTIAACVCKLQKALVSPRARISIDRKDQGRRRVKDGHADNDEKENDIINSSPFICERIQARVAATPIPASDPFAAVKTPLSEIRRLKLQQSTPIVSIDEEDAAGGEEPASITPARRGSVKRVGSGGLTAPLNAIDINGACTGTPSKRRCTASSPIASSKVSVIIEAPSPQPSASSSIVLAKNEPTTTAKASSQYSPSPAPTLCPSSPSPSIVMMTSGLSVDQRDIIESSYRQMPHARITLLPYNSGVRINWSRITHIVTSTNDAGLAPRTAKYLRGILLGIPIVTYDWYLASLPEGPVPVDDYLVKGDEVTGRITDAVVRSVTAHRSSGKRRGGGGADVAPSLALLNGMDFYLSGNFVGPGRPSRSELTSLIEAGGGRVLTRRPSKDRAKEAGETDEPNSDAAITITATAATDAKTNTRGTAHSFSWLLDCISNYQILP